MNIMVRLNVSRVSLPRVCELFGDDSTKIVADECFDADTILQKEHEFHNSVIIKFARSAEKESEKRTIAIKLFVNGTLQVSGCKEMEDALMNGQLMCRFLERMDDVACGTYTVVDVDVHMINCNFSLSDSCCINLVRLHDEIDKRCKLFQRYDASSHAGLIISVRSMNHHAPITTMVFSNANVIITGFKDWDDLAHVYETIVRLVDECFDDVTIAN